MNRIAPSIAIILTITCLSVFTARAARVDSLDIVSSSMNKTYKAAVVLHPANAPAHAPGSDLFAQHSKGVIVGPTAFVSRVYPGTTRNYWVYVPSQYDPSEAACVMVVQDGLSRAQGWKLPQVMDSLIAAKRIPVMLGIFVDPGIVTGSREGAYPRYNRSLEYDAMGDRYASFLITELMPEIQRTYNIKTDPDSRGIAGASSGAICAFNVAWERPDQFRRVLSTIGTYVGLRGADEFVTLIRKTESKPIRVFLEDGSSDLNIYAGDWWSANLSMLSALTYAGYEVEHRWGSGGHDSKHAATVMAEAMEWLWKDYPTPVTTHKGVKPRLDLLLEDESWTEIPLDGHGAGRLTVASDGSLYFTENSVAYRVNKQQRIEKADLPTVDLLAGSSSGWYGWVKSSRRLVAIDTTAKMSTIARNIDAGYLCAAPNGLYVADHRTRRIGFYDAAKKTMRYFRTTFTPGAMSVSAEKTFLNVASKDTPFGHSLKINTDGSLSDEQPYVHYHVPYGQTLPETGGMDVDRDNVVYTATAMGIQVSDQLGRVNFIFSKPGATTTDVKLSGNLLYVVADNKLFVRKINAKGLGSFEAPSTPPKPQL